MNTQSAKPEGIEQRDEFEGVLYAWPLPSAGPVRYVMAVFFALGTLVWVAGLVAAILKLLASRDIEMVMWIVGWTVCGIWLPGMLWALLRRRPESVRLGNGDLTHDPGVDMTSPQYLAGLLSGSLPVLPGKPITVPRGEFVLNGGQIVYDGKQVEIGACLPKEKREWLLAVLETWRRG